MHPDPPALPASPATLQGGEARDPTTRTCCTSPPRAHSQLLLQPWGLILMHQQCPTLGPEPAEQTAAAATLGAPLCVPYHCNAGISGVEQDSSLAAHSSLDTATCIHMDRGPDPGSNSTTICLVRGTVGSGLGNVGRLVCMAALVLFGG